MALGVHGRLSLTVLDLSTSPCPGHSYTRAGSSPGKLLSFELVGYLEFSLSWWHFEIVFLVSLFQVGPSPKNGRVPPMDVWHPAPLPRSLMVLGTQRGSSQDDLKQGSFLQAPGVPMEGWKNVPNLVIDLCDFFAKVV